MRSQKMGVVVCTCVLAGGALVGETGTTIGADSRPIIVSDLETSYEVGTSNGGGGCVRDPVWICDGDTDGDGQVNPVDSGLVQAAFGSDDEAVLCQYDVDCDGQINPVDSGIVQSLFGTCNAPRDSCGVACGWDNNVIPDGFSGRAISPPNFPDIRVVDDVDVGGGCEIFTLRANIIEDAGWIPGDVITVYTYEDTGSGPGALMDAVDLPFTRTATGDNYFGRDDYDYFVEGVGITLPKGVSWIGMRNPDGSGAGTNYWMTSDGGPDGPGSDTGWFSLDGGNSFNPEGAGWHHAFEVAGGPEGSGACCLPDGSCTDDVPGSECFNVGGRFAIDTLCADIDPPCEAKTGACCQGLECLDTALEAECDKRGGSWFEGETCPEFECPERCAWDNGMIPNDRRRRGISPPLFPNVRVVDDIVTEQPGCRLVNFHANVTESRRWTDGGMITVYVYEDTGRGPGALLASEDSEFSKIATGDSYGGREDYDYWVEGLAIDLPAGRSWIGFRNAGGGGSNSNYWMTSDGGADGPGSESGWISFNGGRTFTPEDDGFHYAFEVVQATIGACCMPSGFCLDDVPLNDCRTAGGRFGPDTSCADLDPPCDEQTGRCCIDGEEPECAVIMGTACARRGGEFAGFATDCEDDPCGFAEGACCSFPECSGTMRKAECGERGGRWFQGETCPEFECPERSGCDWDNGMIPNGFSGRALSPPNFPDIRVVDDIVAEQPGCTVLNFHANVIEDAAWTDGGIITVDVYEDTGDGPGALLASEDSEFSKIATGDLYGGREDYDYWVEGLAIDLPAGRSWIGIRNAAGGGAGTNYWMTSDGGADGPGSETGWFSLDAGKTFNPEGAGWHHAFEIVP